MCLRIVVLLAMLTSMTACKENIVHDLPESEANRISSRLHQAGFPIEKVEQTDGLWSLAVDDGYAPDALRYLEDARIIRQQSSAEERSSFMLSRDEQRFRIERALSREIEGTLRSLSGVLEARVHLNQPPRDPLFGHRLEKSDSASASVLLVTSADLSLDTESIKQLVGGAAGINSESVVVVVNSSTLNPFELQRERPGTYVSGLRKPVLIAVTSSLFILGLLLLALFSRSLKRSSFRFRENAARESV